MADMFNKSFTVKVTTDAEGKFCASAPVEGASMFSVKVNVRAVLQEPADTSVAGVFAISPNQPRAFAGATGESVSLGKWAVAKGTSTATASGSTNPPQPRTELTVLFEASL